MCFSKEFRCSSRIPTLGECVMHVPASILILRHMVVKKIYQVKIWKNESLILRTTSNYDLWCIPFRIHTPTHTHYGMYIAPWDDSVMCKKDLLYVWTHDSVTPRRCMRYVCVLVSEFEVWNATCNTTS